MMSSGTSCKDKKEFDSYSSGSFQLPCRCESLIKNQLALTTYELERATQVCTKQQEELRINIQTSKNVSAALERKSTEVIRELDLKRRVYDSSTRDYKKMLEQQRELEQKSKKYADVMDKYDITSKVINGCSFSQEGYGMIRSGLINVSTAMNHRPSSSMTKKYGLHSKVSNQFHNFDSRLYLLNRELGLKKQNMK